MINLGLAGQASSGKDTVADYLVARYGFIKYSFSDALYREVTEAFSLPDDSMLRDRTAKEVPTERLSLVNCMDDEFIGVAVQHIHGSHHQDNEPLSPRQILQYWGTEYRRAADPDYWVKKARDWVCDYRSLFPYAELRPQLFVNTSVRFENEREMISHTAYYETKDATSWEGTIWHLRRDTTAPVHAHQSETPLPVLDGERQIWNNAGLEQLYRGVDLLLSTNATFVRCEPMRQISGTCTAAEFEQYGRKFIDEEITL
jgi:hypothetical protein